MGHARGSNLTDFMVVCSGSSMPHLRAVLRDVAGSVEEEHGSKPAFSEGKADTRWVVLDYVDVMVHVMHQEMRDFYSLEELWAGCEGSGLEGKDGSEISRCFFRNKFTVSALS